MGRPPPLQTPVARHPPWPGFPAGRGRQRTAAVPTQSKSLRWRGSQGRHRVGAQFRAALRLLPSRGCGGLYPLPAGDANVLTILSRPSGRPRMGEHVQGNCASPPEASRVGSSVVRGRAFPSCSSHGRASSSCSLCTERPGRPRSRQQWRSLHPSLRRPAKPAALRAMAFAEAGRSHGEGVFALPSWVGRAQFVLNRSRLLRPVQGADAWIGFGRIPGGGCAAVTDGEWHLRGSRAPPACRSCLWWTEWNQCSAATDDARPVPVQGQPKEPRGSQFSCAC